MSSNIRAGDNDKKPNASPVKWYLGIFIGFFIIFSGFSLATPLYGSADEPAQVIYAAAAVRGEFFEPPAYGPFYPKSNKSTPYVAVRVPYDYARSLIAPLCYVNNKRAPASCMPDFYKLSSKLVNSETYVGRYIPSYYVIVGLPSLIFPNATGVYLMRIVSDVLNAIFVSIGFYMLISYLKNWLFVVVAFLALTPACIYWASMVNPNGLEITTAFASWVIAGIFLVEKDRQRSYNLALFLLISLSCLTIVRALSPLWAIIIVSVVILVKPRYLFWLYKNKKVQLGILILFFAMLYALIWDITAGSLIFQNPYVISTPFYRDGFIGRFLISLKEIIAVYNQDIAVFDWNNLTIPKPVTIFWAGLIIFVILMSLLVQSVVQRLVTVILVIFSFFIPAFFNALEARHFGNWWQGRYGLPVVIGAIIIPGLFLANAENSKTVSKILKYLTPTKAIALTMVLAIITVFCLYWDVRRNAVGINGPLNIFGQTPWHGPLDNFLIFLPIVGYYILLVKLKGFVGQCRQKCDTIKIPSD